MKELLYEGKAKQVYKSDNDDCLIIKYKNTATAFNGVKKVDFEGKGKLNCTISNMIFRSLEKKGIPTHLVESIDDITILVKKVDIVPLEVIVRNIAAGSFVARYGAEEGMVFDEPIVEFSYKQDSLNDPLINNFHIVALKLATKEDLQIITDYALQINEYLKEIFLKGNMKLVDFKIEFGKTKDGTIILADEISPDSCRLWDVNTNQKLDKDVFRKGIGDLITTYEEVLGRMIND
ncbi:MAG: phosphoribosylaminoimidazolesuccinocarboxamide synthase [Clostridia bacterium]